MDPCNLYSRSVPVKKIRSKINPKTRVHLDFKEYGPSKELTIMKPTHGNARMVAEVL